MLIQKSTFIVILLFIVIFLYLFIYYIIVNHKYSFPNYCFYLVKIDNKIRKKIYNYWVINYKIIYHYTHVIYIKWSIIKKNWQPEKEYIAYCRKQRIHSFPFISDRASQNEKERLCDRVLNGPIFKWDVFNGRTMRNAAALVMMQLCKVLIRSQYRFARVLPS